MRLHEECSILEAELSSSVTALDELHANRELNTSVARHAFATSLAHVLYSPQPASTSIKTHVAEERGTILGN